MIEKMNRKKAKKYDGEETIHSAVRGGDVEVVRELLKNEVSANLQNHVTETPLHVACQIDDCVRVELPDRLSILQSLWESGAKMNAKGGLRKETPLHFAVKSQQVDVVNFLLNHGASANSRDKDNRTPLHLVASAVSKDHGKNEAIFKLLIQHGANFHAQDSRYRSPLIESVCSGNADIVKLLLEVGAQMDFMNRLGLSALFYACEMQNVEMTKVLLERHASVNMREQRKRSTPLHYVAGSGRHYTFGDDAANRSHLIAQLLIENGADIDAEDIDGSTALHIAVDTKDEQLVKVLLEAKAGVNAKDDYGNTPLHVLLLTAQANTCNEGRLERIARLLVAKGASVNEQNNNLETPFHYSLWRGNSNVVSNLLDNGADMNTLWHAQKGSLQFLHESPSCNTPEICGDNVEEAFVPLNVASALGHTQIVDFLLDHKDSINIETGNYTGNHDVSKTPLYFAVKNGHYEVAKLLLDAGCNINRYVLHNTTVLHVAVSKGNAALTYLLLEYGADSEIKDVYERTALSCAVEYDRESLERIAKILIMYRVIREFQNFKTNEADLEIMRLRKRLDDFYLDCLCELTKMKEEILYDNISMFSIVSKNIDSLAICLGNENVINSFVSKNIEDDYPIYCDMLRIHFDLALERKGLFDSAIISLNTLFKNVLEALGYETMPEIIMQKIVYFFNLRDLRKIIFL